MKSRGFVFLLIALIQISCSRSTTLDIENTEPPTKPAELAPELDTNKPPVIHHFITEVETLCPGSRTRIEFEASDPDGDPIDAKITADLGEIVQDGEHFFYQAPDYTGEMDVDTVLLEVFDDEKTTKASLTIMLIDQQNAQQWVQTGGPEGGVVNTIEIDPNNPDVLYAAGKGGRLVKTINGGEHWEMLPKIDENGSEIFEILLDPDNSERIFARSFLLFRSDDGGQTFRELNLGLDGVSSLAINPDNGQQLLAGTWHGIAFLSENGGDSWRRMSIPVPPNSTITAVAIASEEVMWAGSREWESEGVNIGILYRSIDGGTTWEEILNTDFAHESAIASIMVPYGEPDTVFVGLVNINNEPFDIENDRFFLKSTDRGNSWDQISVGWEGVWIGIIDLVDQPSWDDTIYFGNGGDFSFKSTDGGETFEPIELGTGRQGDIADIAIDPRDTNVLYLPTKSYGILKSMNGGDDWEWINNGIQLMSISLLATEHSGGNGLILGTSAGGEGQFISKDYGESWFRVSLEEINHPWGDEIKVNPHNPSEYWFIADISEISVSEDEGQTWERKTSAQWDASGFSYGSVYAIAPSASNSRVIYSAKNGFGLYRTDGFNREEFTPWQFLHQSEIDYTFAIAVHPEQENIIYSGSIPKPFQTNSFIRRSWDGGENWETVMDIPDSGGITAVAFAGNSTERLFAGSVGNTPAIYRSDDIGSSWRKVAFPFSLVAEGIEQIEFIEIIPFPENADVMFLSVYPGGIFFTGDAGESWIRFEGIVPDHIVQDGMRQGRYNFTFSPAGEGAMYVAIFDEGVFKSTDWGSTWKLVSNQTKGLGILSFAADPVNEDLLYLGSRAGMFRSEDGGANWTKFERGKYIADTDVRTLEFGPDGTLFAGTLGYEILFLSPGTEVWKQVNLFGNFGTFWPIWDGRPLYQYTFLAFHPTDPNTILLGTFPAGIFISHDGGDSWQESNTNWTWDGVFSLIYHPADTNIIYSGTYNGMNRSIDGGQSWEMWDKGWADEQWVFSIDFDSRDPNVMYAVSKNGENEGRGQPGIFMGAVMKSEDGGESWFEIMSGLPRDNEYYKIIVDPYLPDVLYLASQFDGVFISYDQGAHWEQWNEGLFSKVAGTNGNNVTNTMVLSPDGLHLYFATTGSGVFRRMTISAPEICGCVPVE